MIRVLIADDHQLFAEGLSGALDALPDIQVVGVLNDGSQVAERTQALSPDVILMDLEMPTGGLEVLPLLKGTPVVIVTMHSAPDRRMGALDAGAVGFLPKSAPLADLAAAIRAAAAGCKLLWQSDDDKRALLKPFREPRLDPGAESLTDREVEILTLLGQGISSTEELADRLYISQKTVKNHLASIFSKLAISDRTQAAVEAIRLGFAKPK